MNKKYLRTLIMTIGLTVFSTLPAHAQGKIVAMCGAYRLEQNVTSRSLVGILHQENTYRLINAGGEGYELSLGSSWQYNGEVLRGSVDVLASASGAIFKVKEVEVIADPDDFRMMIGDSGKDEKVKLPCRVMD